MAFETDPAGLGVGKTYGPQGLVAAGHIKTEGVNNEAAFELNVNADIRATYTVQLPSLAIVTAIYTEVEVAFDGTLPGYTATLDGGTASAEFALATIGITSETLGAMGVVTDAGGGALVITPDAAAIAATVGEARIVVEYKQM